MKLVNLTPHAVNIANSDGKIVREIPSIGSARVSSQAVPGEPIDGVPFAETVFGTVEGLPESDGETTYIVSQMVIGALPNRTDLVRPDTGPGSVVRDSDGKIVAVRGLTK